MGFAYPMQKFQDWLTQQWVIFRGRKIDPKDFEWLVGPFGNQENIGDGFINQFAERENLIIERGQKSQGLIPDIKTLNLSAECLSNLSGDVISFYEKTSDYDLNFTVSWNLVFKFFGVLLNQLFSNRINQLNIPTTNIASENLQSEIITLLDPETKQVKYTFWYRTIQSSGKVIYSGVYSTCRLASGKTCIKAVFPLPNGNATVIMLPHVEKNGHLILDSSGKRFGDAGFYFLLKDSKGKYWSQYIRSFRDRLIIGSSNNQISAEQTLTLWHQKVLRFNYNIKKKCNDIN